MVISWNADTAPTAPTHTDTGVGAESAWPTYTDTGVGAVPTYTDTGVGSDVSGTSASMQTEAVMPLRADLPRMEWADLYEFIQKASKEKVHRACGSSISDYSLFCPNCFAFDDLISDRKQKGARHRGQRGDRNQVN